MNLAAPAIVSLDAHLTAEDVAAELRQEVRAGLTATPKELQPKWLYDERGCELFDRITRLPEYYPTRREREILYSEAATIARVTGADTLVELGSGNGEKTLLLLDPIHRAGRLRRFVALDVAECAVLALADTVVARFGAVPVHGVVGDFERHVHLLPADGRRLIAFLGGTIGNLEPSRRRRFLSSLAATMRPGDHLLLGHDLVKPIGRLESAYDDAEGVTAAFNLNLLAMLNRELGADFDAGGFRHVARFDRDQEWVELLLRSTRDQRVRVRELGLDIAFAEGEEMRTEISAKFRPGRMESELAEAGLRAVGRWTDSRGDFALVLAAVAAAG